MQISLLISPILPHPPVTFLSVFSLSSLCFLSIFSLSFLSQTIPNSVSESAKVNRRSASKKKVDYSAPDEFEFDDEDNLPLSQMSKGKSNKKKTAK